MCKPKKQTEIFAEFLLPFAIAILNFLTISHWLDVSKSENFIISLLSCLIAETMINFYKQGQFDRAGSYIKREHFIDKSLTQGNEIISELLNHFAKDCFKRCHNNSDHCVNCEHFSSGCSGLLQHYLHEESTNLSSALKSAKQGQYTLNTNIKKFHTIAIDHLIGTNSQHYTVIHTIGKVYHNEETYDELDFHFLHALLEKLTEKRSKNESYVKRNSGFKIRWLLIGEKSNIKNTYDYIFYVVDKSETEESVKDFFKFYVMTEENYNAKLDTEYTQLSNFAKKLFDTNPNIGIFGNYFMFAESNNSIEYGTIYTNLYKDSSSSKNIGLVDESLVYLNVLISKAECIGYEELKDKYSTLLKKNKNHIKTLSERCNKKEDKK